MYRIAISGVIAACVLLTGCEPLQPFVKSSNCTMVEPRTSEPRWTSELARINKRVEGFGGFYWEAPPGLLANRHSLGTLHVFLLNPSPETGTRAQQVIADVTEKEGLAEAELSVHQGQYSYFQLKEWYHRAFNVGGMSGLVSSDLNEGKNRLSYGVENEDARACLKQNLEAMDVPRGAVIIEHEEQAQLW